MITITLEQQHFKEKFQDKLDFIICEWLHGSSLNTKAKKKEEQEKNKDDHVDHQHLPDPRQHRKSSFSATNVSERTTSISAQLQLSNLHRIHPW